MYTHHQFTFRSSDFHNGESTLQLYNNNCTTYTLYRPQKWHTSHTAAELKTHQANRNQEWLVVCLSFHAMCGWLVFVVGLQQSQHETHNSVSGWVWSTQHEQPKLSQHFSRDYQLVSGTAWNRTLYSFSGSALARWTRLVSCCYCLILCILLLNRLDMHPT